MAKKNNLNLITTECGQQFVINFLDQVALGIVEDSSECRHNSLFIPPTYSLYRTISDKEYLLEITHFNPKTNALTTAYKLIPEPEAVTYIENGNLNVLMH